jgi:ParB/RepB/Spo0J family partition protein
MAGKAGQNPMATSMPKGSARVANVLEKLKSTGMVPGYAPEQVGAQAHNPDEKGVIWVDIDHILDSPYQHEEQIDEAEVQALVASIEKEGFLAALNVNEDPLRAGYYILTAGGHQRRNAAKAAGKTKIPVFVEPTLDPIRLAFRAAKENAVQVNRSPVNLGNLFLQIQDEFSLTQEEIALELGKTRDFVKTCIAAARSEPDIQALLAQKPDSVRAMGYLRRLNAPEDRAPIIERFIRGEITTDAVKVEVEEILSQQKKAMETSLASPTGEQTTTPFNGVDEEEGSAEAEHRTDGSMYAQRPGVREAGGPGKALGLTLPHKPLSEGQTSSDALAGGSMSGAQGVAGEDDPDVSLRVGKLLDIRTRLEGYQRLLRKRKAAQKEQDVLHDIDLLVQALKQG